MKKHEQNEKLNTQVENTLESTPKKGSKKKSIIVWCAVGVPLTALLVAGGVILGKDLGGKAFYRDPYANIDINNLDDDYTEAYERYVKSNASTYYQKFNDVELVNIALLNLNHVDNFYAITTGSVKAAGVTQTINATYIKNGSDYFEESITSSSFVKGANRFYQVGDETNWYKGKYVNQTEGDYSKCKPTTYKNDEFEETWGRKISRACVYIINETTCLNSTQTNNNDGTVTIDLELDPSLSVVRYTKQMVLTGGLSEKPVFHSVKLSFTLDKDVKLLTFKTDEVYDVHMVIDAKDSKGQITQDYTYSERKIPEINENANYEK